MIVFNSCFAIATVPATYVQKPNAIPNEIEYVSIIIIIVMNTEATITRLSQSMSLIWTNINMPTITSAAVVTDGVNNARTTGAKNTERMNNIPVITAVRPVLPPRPTPLALSTYADTVLDLNIALIIPPRALQINALLIPSIVPSSFSYPHSFARGIKVPVVSKNETKSREKIIMTNDGIFLNSSSNHAMKDPYQVRWYR